MEETYFLKLFGTPELFEPGGSKLKFRTRKQLALLIVLVVEGRARPITRDTLVDLFWANDTPERARHSLSQALSEIRKKIGPDAIIADRHTVCLAEAFRTDSDPNSPTPTAKDLERPLDGLETCAGSEFSHWVDGQRSKMQLRYRALLKDSLVGARSSGGVKSVRESATLLYAVDPMADEAVLALAESHLLDGNPGGALRLLRHHIDYSESDLGRTPSAEVFSALDRIERGAPQTTIGQPDGKSDSQVKETTGHPFIGREKELAQLESLLSKSESRSIASAVIKGPAGIGKSTLLQRFAESLAARGWSFFLVRCFTTGKDIPFAAISELLDRISRDPSLSGTDPLWLSEASRVAPHLRTMYPGVPTPPETPPETVRLRLAEAILRMIETIADDGPVLLGFDDIPDMDPASRDVLHVLTRRMEQTPTLLLGTIRCSENELTLGLPENLKGLNWQAEIAVDPMNETQTLELIGSRLSDRHLPTDDVQRRMAGLATGNPYLAEMLVSDWRNNGENSLVVADMKGDSTSAHWTPPETMRLAFARQYEGLSDNAQQLVQLVATAGRSLPLESTSKLLGLDNASLDRAILELIERAIVRLDGGAVGFRNELHRAYVYFAAMPEPARVLHHTRLAMHFKTNRSENDFQYALEASLHCLKAGMVGEAIELVRDGADLAITGGAPQEAERSLVAVISVCPEKHSNELQIPMARCLCGQGRYTEAFNAIQSWQGDDSTPIQNARVLTLRAEILHRGTLDKPNVIKKTLQDAMDLAELCADNSLVMSILQLSAEIASENSDRNALRSILEKAKRVKRNSSSQIAQGKAHLTQGYCLTISGEHDQARDHFQKAASVFSKLALDPLLRRALTGLGVSEYCAGDIHDSLETFQAAIDIASSVGDLDAAATLWSNMAALHDILGNSEKAEECIVHSINICDLAANPRRMAESYHNAACFSLTRGMTTQARQALDRGQKWVERSKLPFLLSDALLIRADINVAEGNPEQAWILLERVQVAQSGPTYTLSGIGRYERLRRHHLWATQGVGAMLRLSHTENLHKRCVQLTQRLEVQAFQEWVLKMENSEWSNTSSAFAELRARKFFGIIQYLEAMHVTEFPTERTDQIYLR